MKETNRKWNNGWCTYVHGFDKNPDVEVICGGDNDKTPTAAAIWRQGHLLHFGFEQSPEEMNEAGHRLLLNSIAYISDFKEDRPIAVTPSVFGDVPVAWSKNYLDSRLGVQGSPSEAKFLLSDETFQQLQGKPAEEVRTWFKKHRPFFRPSAKGSLEIDPDAKELEIPIDDLSFFDRCLAALKKNDDSSTRAKKLLERFGPMGNKPPGEAAGLEKWLAENRPYLFFSDEGDYQWYIDPLAKKRGVPSSEMRGPKRATRVAR